MTYFVETFENGIELIRFANTILHFDSKASEDERLEFINDRLIESYKNYEPGLDRQLLPVLMRLYAERSGRILPRYLRDHPGEVQR